VDPADRTGSGAVPVEGLISEGPSTQPTPSSAAQAGTALPRGVRRSLAAVRVELRRPSARLRAWPNFLVLGAQRCGTTSLYRYLIEHPEVSAPLRKEIQYFTLRHARGESWYRAHFTLGTGKPQQTFDATPYYLFHPLAPARAAEVLPRAKLVVLVRDPVRRAFSHWQHTRARGLEPLDFEEALDAEPARLAGVTERLVSDPSFRSDGHRLWSYASRGQYAEQLERWLSCYPREQLLVLRSEDLYHRPAETYARTLEFLGLPLHELAAYPRHTRGTPAGDMSEGARHRLIEHFRPHNARLAVLLGRDTVWDD
jgi:sulfotransferase family protein